MAENVSRAEFEARLAAVPQAIADAIPPAITSVITQTLKPIVDKLNRLPEDYSEDLTALQNLPATVAAATAGAVQVALTAALAPPAEETPSGVETPAAALQPAPDPIPGHVDPKEDTPPLPAPGTDTPADPTGVIRTDPVGVITTPEETPSEVETPGKMTGSLNG